jgi:translation initiation factor 1
MKVVERIGLSGRIEVYEPHQSMSAKSNVRTVYSTSTGGKCPVCGWPQRSCKCSSQNRPANEPLPARIVAKLRIEKKGRGGKIVTVVYDLPRNDAFLNELAARLKRECGTGGAVTETGIELQGEMRDRVRVILQGRGYTVKGGCHEAQRRT